MNDILDPSFLQTAIAAVDNPPPAVYLHCAVKLDDGRVLGAETLRLVNFKGQEKISEPFEFQLELHGNTDYRQPALGFDQLMGCPVTFGVQLPAEGDRADDPGWANACFADALNGKTVSRLSLFNGIVGGLAMELPGVYRITVKPALWRLSLTNHYRAFSQMSVAQAIAAVLDEHDVAYDMKSILSGDNLASSRVQDWLQAGESDFDFIRRLMGKAHLYYYFQYSGNGHVVTFSNQAKYMALPLSGPLRYTYTVTDELGLTQDDVVSQYSIRQNLISSGVHSVFATTEETWEQPPIPVFQTYADDSSADTGTRPFRLHKLYQYGGSKLEVRDHTIAASKALAATGLQFSGASACPLFRTGYQFQVREDMAPGTAPQPVCPSLDGRWFVLTSVQHDASLDGKYGNQFEATDADALVTPFSIQETQQGVVLAKVVGHGKEEAPSDWRFYAKNVFDLKLMPMEDKLSADNVVPGMPTLSARGVLVQFATDNGDGPPVWVKLASHMQTVPEIGVTVLVTRANDESELPEIQSIVHNNGNKVVVPGTWTASTFVGNAYSTTYSDGVSVRFGWKSPADLDAAVAIATQQYATGEYKDSSYSMGGSYSYNTADNGKDGLLSRSDSFGSTYSTHHGAMSQSTSVFDITDSNSTVNGTATSVSSNNIVNSTSTTNVQTSSNTIGSTTSTDTIGTADSTGVTGQSNSVHATGTSTSMQAVGSSQSVSMEGSTVGMSLTGTRSNISLLGDGCDLSLIGSQSSISAVGMRSNMDAVGASSGMSLVGSSDQMSLTGASTGMSLTGSASNMSLTGSSSGMNIVGASDDLSVVGSSSRISVTGSSTDISMVGDTTSISMIGSSTSISMHGGGLSLSVSSPQTSISLSGTGINIVATIEITL